MDSTATLTDNEIPSNDTMAHTNPTANLLQLQEKVFGNELIMRKILSKLLWYEDTSRFHSIPKLSSSQARNIRLVSKMWLQLTTTYFAEHLMPLLSFEVHSEPDIPGQVKNKFSSFMEDLMNGTLTSPPPPFSLKIWIMQPLADECIDMCPLLDILFSHKTTAHLSLVSFAIYNPRRNSFEFPRIPAYLKLPFLREFTIDDNGRLNLRRITRENNMVLFSKSVLNASVVLTQFNLDLNTPVDDNNADWNLPGTLAQLKIHFKTIFHILNNSTLHPLLPQLRALEICRDSEFHNTSNQIEEIKRAIDLSMPLLDKLVLNVGSLEELEEWFHPDWEKWPRVKTLGLRGIQPIPQQYMARIHGGFEALVNLELECYGEQGSFNLLKSGMRYIFEKMRHMRCLKMKVFNLAYTEESEWDRLLTGIPSQEILRQLKQDRTLWEEFCKRDEEKDGRHTGAQRKQGLSSIRNLQQLECLHLSGNMDYGYGYSSNTFEFLDSVNSVFYTPPPIPFISELAFTRF